MGTPTDYFERRANGYLEACGKGLWGRLKAAEWAAIEGCLDLAPGLAVLDAGCGPGYYSLRMRGAANVTVSGIDSSRAMVEEYRSLGFGGELAPLESFRTGLRYDRILAAGVLEFIEDPAAALLNLAGLLRSGGRLVCLVPAAGLAGAVYRAAHRLRGCPVFIREPSLYFQLARDNGLRAVKLVNATPISRAFALERDGHG